MNSITIKAVDSSLSSILQDIAKRTGIKVYGDSSLLNEKITAEFQDITVEELLKKILGKYNFALVYASPEAGGEFPSSPVIKEAWIFSGSKKVVTNGKMSDNVLYDPSPQVRLKALQLLAGTEDIEEIARHALNDPDISVQETARDILRNISEEDVVSQPDDVDLNITDFMGDDP